MPYAPPKVRCSERSGYSCDEIVSVFSRHCGNPQHYPGANGGLPVSRNRRRKIGLTVDEDYDLIDESPDLDPVTFDARRVWVTGPALDAWGRHPRALQANIRLALSRGGYWRTTSGGHLLEIGRHQIELSGDGRYCTAYALLPSPPALPCASPIDALEAPGWDQDGVVLSPHAIRQFAGRHRVDEDAATDELFELLDDATARGKHLRDDNEQHILSVDGFVLTLTADGATVIDYKTVHAERTPSEVRNKVPSRFHERHLRSPEQWAAWMIERDLAVSSVPLQDWVSTAEIGDHFDPDRARITGVVVAHDRPERPAELLAIRDCLRSAKAEGRWTTGPEGCHSLEHDGRVWTISPNGRAVLSCESPWHSVGESAHCSGSDQATLVSNTEDDELRAAIATYVRELNWGGHYGEDAVATLRERFGHRPDLLVEYAAVLRTRNVGMMKPVVSQMLGNLLLKALRPPTTN